MSWDYSWELPSSIDQEAVERAAAKVMHEFPGTRFRAAVDEDLAEFADEILADGGGDLLLSIPAELAEAYDEYAGEDEQLEAEFRFLPAEGGIEACLVIYSDDADNRQCWSALGAIVGRIATTLGWREEDEQPEV